ncbi:hypothetical protein JCM8097_003672 [Rhodosporidiobolus ruineniae]
MFSINETSPLSTPSSSASSRPSSSRPRSRASSITSSHKSRFFGRLQNSMRRSQSAPIPQLADATTAALPVLSKKSVGSWWSDDSSDEQEELDTRSWRLPAMKRRRTERSLDPLPVPPNLGSTRPCSPTKDEYVLPPPCPLDLDFHFDFDLDFSAPSTPKRLSRANPRASLVVRNSVISSASHPLDPRHISWGSSTAHSGTPSTRWSGSTRADWTDAFSPSSPYLSRSPDMMEEDSNSGSEYDDDDAELHGTPKAAAKAAKVDQHEDRDLHAFLLGPSSMLKKRPAFPAAFPVLRRSLDFTGSTESLLDPGPGSPKSARCFGLDFPLPPSPTSPPASPIKLRGSPALGHRRSLSLPLSQLTLMAA